MRSTLGCQVAATIIAIAATTTTALATAIAPVAAFATSRTAIVPATIAADRCLPYVGTFWRDPQVGVARRVDGARLSRCMLVVR